jgi:hypothetical protein
MDEGRRGREEESNVRIYGEAIVSGRKRLFWRRGLFSFW